MSLKIKRNLPTLLLLAAILSSLLFLLGNQPVIAYTLEAEAPSSIQSSAGGQSTPAAAALQAGSLTQWTGLSEYFTETVMTVFEKASGSMQGK